MKYDVAVVADLCLDILLSGKVKPIYGQVEQYIDDYAIELGGSAAIFASQFTKLGGKVGLIGSVGEDTFGDILLQKLKHLHISTDHVIIKPEIKTSVGVGLSYYDDRAMLTFQGSMAALSAEDILNSKVLNHTCHLHIAGYFLLDQLFSFWPDVIIELQSKGITTSLDTNWSPNNDWKKVMELLPSINVFMPNEEEAKKISNKTDVIEAGTWLAKFCQIVVIKRGGDGATIFKDKVHFHTDVPQEISKDLKIADTTGAGDNFDAGFLREWLQGKPLKVCGMTAVKCGTLSLSEIGGIQGQLQENL
ncbi:carbohydrate kinase family protein [Gillisia sp. Q332]|uniref:carbohydrate kinase family protein n=1 Tax=Gillisia xinjiangensis TaxID=3384765 RepID=UPI00391A8F14